MDWITWLSKSNLNPSLVYEYSLAFTQNQLEHEDIIYFNHEFLQSIGISIAKHRLEILKLAALLRRRRRRPITARLLLALNNTKRRFSDLIRSFNRRRHEKALILLPRSIRDGDEKLVAAKHQERFLLTNGSPPPSAGDVEGFSGQILYDLRREEKGDSFWGNDVKEFRWDAMFHNLKPT